MGAGAEGAGTVEGGAGEARTIEAGARETRPGTNEATEPHHDIVTCHPMLNLLH